VRNYFRVGVRAELEPMPAEFFSQLDVVLDDAVVND
jgi:hypothetical protein